MKKRGFDEKEKNSDEKKPQLREAWVKEKTVLGEKGRGGFLEQTYRTLSTGGES